MKPKSTLLRTDLTGLADLADLADMITGFKTAISLASRFRGATSPNPPVGAAALSQSGQLLAVTAHEKAGTAHAEAKLLSALSASEIAQIQTLFITLEPCNHQGRTPPCTEAIVRAFKLNPGLQVVYAIPDPNPRVAGGGGARLISEGIPVLCLADVAELPSGLTQVLEESRELIAPFSKWARTGVPWVTVKTAWNAQGTMIPPKGQKTFSSPESLKLAHQLRGRADAIITGSGTVLADSPEFTVRYAEDPKLISQDLRDQHRQPLGHPKRLLTVLDRRKRVPSSWFEARREFEIVDCPPELNFPDFLRVLGGRGVLEVLIEAGPKLSGWILEQGLWDEHVRISDTEGTRRILNR